MAVAALRRPCLTKSDEKHLYTLRPFEQKPQHAGIARRHAHLADGFPALVTSLFELCVEIVYYIGQLFVR